MSQQIQQGSGFNLSELFRKILEAFQDCFQFGRNVLKKIGEATAKFLRFIGNKLLALIDNATFWKYVKLIPVLSTIFGSARCIRHLISGNYQEAIKSGIYAAGGIVAIFVPLYFGVACIWGFLLSGTLNNAIGGLGTFLTDLYNDEGLRTANWDDLEEEFYSQIVKVTPLLAVGYCPVRALVYICKGNGRQAKISAKDLIINGTAIAAAYWIIQLLDCSVVVRFIEENLSAVTNGFIRVILRILQRLICQGVVRETGVQAINVAAQLVRNSSLITEAGFPYYEIDPAKFISCLKNPQIFFNGGVNDAHMQTELMEYIVKCLVQGYQNNKDAEDNDKDAVQVAFEGGNPILLQAILCFSPSVMDTMHWASLVSEMLNDSRANECVKFILKNSCPPLPVEVDSRVCCSNHSNFKIARAMPTITRPTNPKPNVRGQRILCIDGGGTRGLVSLELLRHIEKHCPGPISQYLDVIIGTSTGGVIALLLADGRFRIPDIYRMYFELKNEVFSGRRGNLSALERLLRSYFPENKLMGQIPNSVRVIITSSTIENNEFQRKFFTNFHEESAAIPIWQVARCTTAAPGYFPPFMDENGVLHFDGGLTCNNPVFAALRIVGNHSLENSTIVSIGTGRYMDDTEIRNLRISRSLPGQVRMIGGGTLKQFVDLLVNQVTRTENDIIEDSVQLCESAKAYFYRLNPILPENVELDEINDTKLINAIWQSRVFAFSNEEIIKEIASRLRL